MGSKNDEYEQVRRHPGFGRLNLGPARVMDARPAAQWMEIWLYPDQSNGHLLVLRSQPDGRCEVVDPQKSWNQVHPFETYEAAYYWLRQETYELVDGRMPLR